VAIIVAAYFILPKHYFTPALPGIFIFFLALTVAGFYLLVRSVHQKFIRFLNIYMLITIVKLILCIAVLVTYLFLNKHDAIPFGLWFFILYIFFTFFEVSSLLTYSKTLHQ
jgi:hypothetical protein